MRVEAIAGAGCAGGSRRSPVRLDRRCRLPPQYFMRGLALILLGLAATAASAEGSSRDRDDLDAAAGRALFQNSPLSISVVEQPRAEPIAVAAVPESRTKRGMRIVYPGPYER
jgi:hypothetical protein